MKTALIVSSLSESYYFEDFLTAADNRPDLDVYLFDTEKYPLTKINIVMDDKGNLSGSLDVWHFDSKTQNYKPVSLEISQIDVAWHLRAKLPNAVNMSTRNDQVFADNECRGALEALWSVVPWRWINRRESIMLLSENKLLQQQLATSVGLSTPFTCISNNSKKIIQLGKEEGELLLKLIRYTDLDTQANLFMYSNMFSANELAKSSSSISNCPVFAQKYVPKKFEYRCMAIGSRILTCRIDSQASEKTKIDWRHYDFKNVRHEKVDLPKIVDNKILDFMAAAKLQYGAIDMIETPEGEFVFLEVNPSGQWGWIAKYANLPIPEVVIDMIADA